MKKQSLSALAAAGLLAGGLSVTSASAADLGGNCCADLEERIAELEATTARKGNRKVSLTISGWVAEQVTYWDDGVEDNVYVTGLGSTLASNVKFTGQATIVPGWTAGYVLHIEADGSDALTTSQGVPNGPGLLSGGFATGSSNFVQTMQSFWFIKSESLGKVSVGLQSMVSDNAAILVDGSGSLVPANWVAFDFRSFGAGGTAKTFGAFGAGGGTCIPGDCYGVPNNSVRYDSPTFAGFSASASWGNDDIWDVGLRYAGEVVGFKLAATVVYAERNVGATDDEYLQAGLYIQHIGTGLFGLVNYADFEDNTAAADDGEVWYFKAGLRQRWTPLGHTVLYGEYLQSEADGVAQNELEWYGAGIVQEIDNAAMSLWLKYRNIEASDNTGVNYEDFNEVTFGALINF